MSSIASSSVMSESKARPVYSSGRGGAGNYKRHKFFSPGATTFSMTSITSLSSRASISSKSIDSSLSPPPSSYSKSISQSSSSYLGKDHLTTDSISMARGRDVIVPTRSARSGRGGLGTHQKIIANNSSFVDPKSHPRTAELMEEYNRLMIDKEREILKRSQMSYSTKVRSGRGGMGNMKKNIIKPEKVDKGKKKAVAIEPERYIPESPSCPNLHALGYNAGSFSAPHADMPPLPDFLTKSKKSKNVMKKLWVKVSGGGKKNASKNDPATHPPVPVSSPSPQSSISPLTPLSAPSFSSDYYPPSVYSESYSAADNSSRYGPVSAVPEWYPLSEMKNETKKKDNSLRSISVTATSEWYSTPDLRARVADGSRRPPLPQLSPVPTPAPDNYLHSDYRKVEAGYRHIPGSPLLLSPITPGSGESDFYSHSDHRRLDDDSGRHVPQFYMLPIPEHQDMQPYANSAGSSSRHWL